MKRIDSKELKICSYQAMLFEKSVECTECSSKIFIRRFMNSKLARRMDNAGYMFNLMGTSEAFYEIEEQYGESKYGIEKYTKEEMHWIGYIYRYWACVTDEYSKQVYNMAKPEKLRKLYFPYHSLDPLQAIERILEEIEPENKSNMYDIERCVGIVRRIRKREKESDKNMEVI